MSTIKFYKDSNGAFRLTDCTGKLAYINKGDIVSAYAENGVCSMIFSDEVYNRFTHIHNKNTAITDFVNASSVAYNEAGLNAVLSDFFVKALTSGGGVEIVNDLTTGGTTKALSAEQGKVLQNAKMNHLQNGSGNVDKTILTTLVGLGLDMSYANLSYANLEGANLEGANLANSYLGDTNLTNSYLSNANLSNANLSYANLTNSYLSNANLSNTNLSYANLEGANLEGANLTNSYLSNANLSNTNLTNSYLGDANLFNSVLSYANLEGANLEGANLANSYLGDATGLNSDINIALADVNKDPNGDGIVWTLTWTDNLRYSCDPSTGLFTLAS